MAQFFVSMKNVFSLICPPLAMILPSARTKRKRSWSTKSRRGKRRAWMMQSLTMMRTSMVSGGKEGEICICFVLICYGRFSNESLLHPCDKKTMAGEQVGELPGRWGSQCVGARSMGRAAVVRCGGGGAGTTFTSGCAGRTGESEDAGTSSTVRP